MQFNAFRRVPIHNVSTDKRDKLAFIRKFLIVWIYETICRGDLLEILSEKTFKYLIYYIRFLLHF